MNKHLNKRKKARNFLKFRAFLLLIAGFKYLFRYISVNFYVAFYGSCAVHCTKVCQRFSLVFNAKFTKTKRHSNLLKEALKRLNALYSGYLIIGVGNVKNTSCKILIDCTELIVSR